MSKFFIGVVVGLVFALVTFPFVIAFDITISLTVITNIIIATATVVATTIHFDSQRKQRADRLWDINKNVLLELAHCLQDAIEATEAEIHNCYSHPEEHIAIKASAWKNLDEKINYALNVYRPLMNEGLIASINNEGLPLIMSLIKSKLLTKCSLK